jgi:hypothetical protein
MTTPRQLSQTSRPDPLHALTRLVLAALAAVLLLAGSGAWYSQQDEAPICRFRVQEIDRSLRVGYAVLPADLDADGRLDIVVVDAHRVIWFQNPDWKLRTILQGQTEPDNVCIAAHDIDGDGQLDLALGAGWRPFQTQGGGTLQWLHRGARVEDPWTMHPIGSEPSLHRIRFADIDGDGRPELLVAPLMGRGATRERNWLDSPVRLLAFRIPEQPQQQRWPAEVLDASLHVVHNFYPADVDGDGQVDILTASYEGVSLLKRREDGTWSRTLLGAGNQATPQGNRGASEIKLGKLRSGTRYLAAIEPWHGHEVVIYTPPGNGQRLWQRQVLDDQLRWGHAVVCADLDRDGSEELIIGVRDRLDDRHPQGVRIYKARDAAGRLWRRQLLDPAGVAVEDLAVADFNNDGWPDIVAVGRATGNVRIYWNDGP